MPQSIGELFVKLGFQVDDEKLKTFDESIKSTFGSIVKLAGIAGGVTGFALMAKGASDTAISVENMTAKYGIATQEIQKFAAAMHQNNPLVSIAQGQQSFGQLAGYLNNAAFYGTGTNSLNQLGVKYSSSMLQHPELVIDQLLQTVPALLAAHPERRGLYSAKLADVFGDVNAIKLFERGRDNYDVTGGRGIVSQDNLDKEVRARENIAALDTQWDTFVQNVTASLAAGATPALKAANEGGAKGFLSYIGQHSWIDWIGEHNYIDAGAHALFGKSNPKLPFGNQSIYDRLIDLGWNSSQAAGAVRRLGEESGLNPDAYGHGKEARGLPGEAYGIAQWHRDRQKQFAKVFGHDIHGSTLDEQLKFMDYELTKGHEKAAGDKLRTAKNADEAYATFTNAYERPAVTVTNNNYITGDDPHAIATAVERVNQQAITSAYLNRNIAGAQ